MKESRILIDSGKNSLSLNLKEILQYKDLFLVLAYRDLRDRYAQTFLGLFWGFVKPVVTISIFTVIFSKGLKVDTGEIPYPLFAFCGMAAWAYFSFVMSGSGGSIIGAQNMIKKIYFPRLIIPLSKIVVGFVDFAIVFSLLVLMMIIMGVPPSKNMVWLPFFILIIIVSSAGVGIWLSALTVKYRDFQHIVPFMVQIGLYATPVAYPAKMIPEKFQLLYHLNPMVGVVDGFRWCIFGAEPPHIYSVISYSLIAIIFISSLFYFKKVEKKMADIV